MSADSTRAEIGLVRYQTNILGTRGPRKMTVLIPKLMSHGTVSAAPALHGSMTQRSDPVKTDVPMTKPPKLIMLLLVQCVKLALLSGAMSHESCSGSEMLPTGTCRIKNSKTQEQCMALSNKPPKWNDQVRWVQLQCNTDTANP